MRYNDSTFAATNMPLTTTYTAVASDTYGRHPTNAASVSLSTNVSFQYDGNGNLTNDGLRNFVYDDENQLVQVFVSNQWKSVFSYDGKMRRRVRTEYTWRSSSWVQTNAVYYVYDGNEVIQERDQNNLPTVTYTRGKDLSGLAPWDAQLSHTGSLEGAGGIGGLLARTDNTSGQTAYYHSDGNGNITMLVNASQAIVAKYLYDAFGNVLSAAGSLAQANLYRFSSKEAHGNSGLVYYLYRYYDPNLQRWPNRDPIAELGSEVVWSGLPIAVPPGELREYPNLYGCVGNSEVDYVDTDGRGLWRGFKNVAGDVWNGIRSTWKVGGAIIGTASCILPVYNACQQVGAARAGWNNYTTAESVLEKKYGDNPADWPPGMSQYMNDWEAALIGQFGQAAAACYKALPDNPATGPVSNPIR